MKTVATLLCIVSLNMSLFADNGKLKPLWEESSTKECKKRCMKVIHGVDEMMDVYDQLWRDGFLSDDELEQIQMAYMRIRFNLGLPSPI